MYTELDKLNNEGMDKIATNLSTANNLATVELREMYAATQSDIARMLAEVNSDLAYNLSEALKDYDASVAEAKRIRDESLKEADAALDAALKESKADFDEAMADANKTLAKAKEEAKKQMDKALEESQKALNKAIEDAMKAFDKAIDAINERMTKKLADLQKKIAEIAAALAQLSAMSSVTLPNTFAVAQPVQTVSPAVYGGGVTVTTSKDIGTTAAKLNKTDEEIINAAAQAAVKAVGGVGNVTINGINLTDPEGTAQALVSVVKYGQTVQVASTTRSGVQMTGLNAVRAGIVQVAQ
jgi:tetratricopeptide (TPR) repeat protein